MKKNSKILAPKELSKELSKTKNESPQLPPLSEKEKAVLVFVEERLSDTGVSPSYQEIRDHFGFASFNSVQNYLKQLTNKGYIQIPSNQKRAILVLHTSQSVQNHIQSKKIEASRGELLLRPSHREEVLSLPLLGKVAAGRPLESFSHDEFIEVAPSLVRNPDKTFALKVSGDSMIEDGIHDGDVILVQKQNSAGNGEIVVASIENESTVKRFFLRPHPESRQKMIELRPANAALTSMWYEPNHVDIQGILVGLIRKF
jgi:repressor LexA